mgnify:CR=1 FL=1
MHIDGQFFFGSATQLISQFDEMLGTKYLILDYPSENLLDISAIFALEDIIIRLQSQKVKILVVLKSDSVKEQFEKGNMKITSAYETSRLSEDAQKEVAAAVEAGADIKSEEIKQMSEEKKKKRKTAEDIAKEQNVSDTDTSEEEKANAKKLHAVKMLEKYYIYLSEEETGILERMLEDCKRRKREYALEED